MHETGWGKFNNAPTAKSRNNWFGIGGDDNLANYICKEESFFSFGKIMSESPYNVCFEKDSTLEQLICIQRQGYNPNSDWVDKVMKIKIKNR